MLLAHCMIWGGWYKLPLPDPKVAVDIFMVVSGYLMVYLAEDRARQEPPGTAPTIMKFWVRRFFRIAPLYYLILVSAFVFGANIKNGYAILQAANPNQWQNAIIYSPERIHYTLANLLMHISFLFGACPAYSLSTGLPDWSIGLEMQFYAAFPLLFFLYHRLGPLRATLLTWGVALVLKHLTYLLLGYPTNSRKPRPWSAGTVERPTWWRSRWRWSISSCAEPSCWGCLALWRLYTASSLPRPHR